MSVYSEFAARNNSFKGYIKPLVKDIDVKQKGNIIWGSLVEGVTELFENHPKDQLATKIPVEGKFIHPEVKVFDAVLALLKNAFVKAMDPYIDHSINIAEVKNQPDKKKGFFENVFGKKKGKKKVHKKK